MGGFVGAWLTAEGIVIWRQVRVSHKPPVPGQMLGVTLLFLALGLVADAVPASRTAVTLGAWGLNVAGILNLWPKGLGNVYTSAQASEAAATTGSSGGAEGSAGPAQQFA